MIYIIVLMLVCTTYVLLVYVTLFASSLAIKGYRLFFPVNYHQIDLTQDEVIRLGFDKIQFRIKLTLEEFATNNNELLYNMRLYEDWCKSIMLIEARGEAQKTGLVLSYKIKSMILDRLRSNERICINTEFLLDEIINQAIISAKEEEADWR